MKPPVIFGTAGHIDHGKTTLTRALSGQDTDRLPEEKARGISIDLGFAHLTLPSGRTAGIIDVPGHERFIRNMVAGVHGMDAAILVVAADEGVMPQTREHLDILEILGVERGITVLTKADLVDREWLDLVLETTREALAETFLAAYPILTVDALSGRGIEDLRKALDRLADTVEPRLAEGFPRLPIDRVFSIRGFGTVVTGTLVAGRLIPDQALCVEPGGVAARVRGLEVHGQPVTEARAGQRVAVNLGGVERTAIRRGQVVTVPGAVAAVETLAVALDLLPGAEPLPMNARVHCHLGTAEAVARVYLYDGEAIQPGDRGYAELRLESPMAAARGDRFLIRSFSPLKTIGGGQVLEPGGRHRRREPGLRARMERLAKGEEQEVLTALIDEADRPLETAWLARTSGIPEERVKALLEAAPQVVRDENGSFWASRRLLEAVAQHIRDRLSAHHRTHPLQPGLDREQLRQEAAGDWPPRAWAWVLGQVEGITVAGEWVSLRGFQPRPDPSTEALYRAIDADGLRPRPLAEHRSHWTGDPAAFFDAVQLLLYGERVYRLEDHHLISDRAYRAGRERVEAAVGTGRTSTSELKDALGTNRRFAVSFLELLDSQHVTRRIGDRRVIS